VAVWAFLFCLSLASCSKDNEYLETPHASFLCYTNAKDGTYVSNEEVLKYEITLNESNSSKNLHIKELY